MKKSIYLGLIVLVALCSMSYEANGSQLPPTVADEMKQREQRLRHLTYDWNLTADKQTSLWSPKQIQEAVQQLQKNSTAEYKANGESDEETQRLVHETVQSFLKITKGSSFRYSDTWRFEQGGQAVLVTGSIQHSKDMTLKYRQYYDGETAMVVFDGARAADGTALSGADPAAWGTSGESVRQFSPIFHGLNLLPEHFATLIGLNALAMHNAQWSLVSTTPDAWVLEAQVQNENTPLTIRMTLSRGHDSIPEDIQIKSPSSTENFHAESYRRYQGDWIADKVVYSHTVPGHFSLKQTWELQDVKPSQALVLKMPYRPVHDYRLMGQNLTSEAVQNAEEQRSHKVVHYIWKGHFPSVDELKGFQDKEHPGEGTPDPNKAASLPFVGGLMCLVGGVWMFKRRGSTSV